MRTVRAFGAIASVVLVVVGASMAPADARPKPRWAASAVATIHPGVQTFTKGAQCTSNFVFYDKKDVYIGQAGHCSGTGAQNEVNGCKAPHHPEGTKVTIEGASRPGVIVYNSWATMQRLGEKNSNACYGNDFALIRINPADRAKVNPSVPVWGGPVGFDRTSAFGETTYTYGDSGLRAGIDALSPKFGISTGDALGGWNHGIYTVTPGIFGDSGSAVLGPTGGALGVLSTIEFLPRPVQNNVSDLSKDLEYMKAHTNLSGVTLANGTMPFAGLL